MKFKLNIIFALFFTIFCVNRLQAQEKAFPKKGEGITLFLKRHNRTGISYQKQFIELNKNKLGKGNTLRIGVKYTLPPLQGKEAVASAIKRANYEPLFGKELASYKVTSSELKGACFYLVSGHGGPDPGAIGRIGKIELHEDEYAYDIILRLGRALMEKGAKVHIIIQDEKDGIRDDRYLSNSDRETCLGQTIPLDQIARLQQRCDAINRLTHKDKEKYKRAIFIHVDSRGHKDQVDVFFYHSPGSKLGKRLTENIHKTFERKYDKHQPNRGFRGTVSERSLYVLKKSNPAAAFLELGNIQNERDRKRLVIPSNRQALADWICQGIIKDFKGQR